MAEDIFSEDKMVYFFHRPNSTVQTFLEVIGQQIILILESWTAFNELRAQVFETKKANEFKEKQKRVRH